MKRDKRKKLQKIADELDFPFYGSLNYDNLMQFKRYIKKKKRR